MSHTNYTSETLRLEPNSSVCSSSHKESERTNNQHLQASVLSTSQGFQKKKVSSFQITSIRPTSRSSNDGADDSENDTEDTSDILDSSRVTIDLDQETPSYSEDYSKSEDLLLGPGPVIPTNSQYGITALVQQTGTGGMMTARLPQGVTVNVTEGGLALAKADGEPDDLDNWQKRFKIVKIDSTEPFKRGRWICLDFMDSPALSSSENKSEEVPLVVRNVVLSDGDAQPPRLVQIPLSLSSSVQYQPTVPQELSNQYIGQTQNTMPGQSTSQIPPVQVQGGVHYAPSGQPMQVVVPPGFPVSQPSQVAVHTPVPGQPTNQVPTSSSQTNIPSNVHSNSEGPQNIGINSCISQSTVPIGIATGLPSHSVSSNHQQQQQQQSSTAPVSQQSEQSPKAHVMNLPQQTLPSGMINQNIQPQIIGIPQGSPAGIPQQQQQQQQQQHPQPPNQPQPLGNQGVQSVSSTQQISQPSASIIHQTQMQSTQNVGMTQKSGGQQIQSPHPGSVTQTSGVAQPMPPGSVSVTAAIQAASYSSLPGTGATPTPATTPAQTQMNIGAGQSSIQTEPLHQIQTPSGGSVSSLPGHHPSNIEGIPAVSQGEAATVSSTATPPTGAPGSEEAESASTASTVAIDNKIEQAMDLVKSHLMFAVREEVDVLKDRIVELMDRIKHLECENTILRQYASPEVLQQLQSQLPHQLSQPPHHSSTS